jgi:hypothetical protein
VLATKAIAAALISDHQNNVCQITKWTALRANHQQLAGHWLMNSQSSLFTCAGVLPGGELGWSSSLASRQWWGFCWDSPQFEGDWENECETGLEWIPGKETLGHCILSTCYSSPSSHTLHELNGIVRFHLHCYDLHCTAIGCWLAVAFRKKSNQVRKLVAVLQEDFSLTP